MSDFVLDFVRFPAVRRPKSGASHPRTGGSPALHRDYDTFVLFSLIICVSLSVLGSRISHLHLPYPPLFKTSIFAHEICLISEAGVSEIIHY